MALWKAFLFGMVGALASYIVMVRDRTFNAVKRDFERNRGMLLFDIVSYIALGGFFAMLIEPSVPVGAVIAGVGWQRIADNFLKKSIEETKEKPVQWDPKDNDLEFVQAQPPP